MAASSTGFPVSGQWTIGKLEYQPPSPAAAFLPMPERRPYRCPICDGCGSVPHDFYTRLGVATSTEREKCRACLGRGIVIA